MATPHTTDSGGPQTPSRRRDLEKLTGGPVAAALFARRKEFLRRTTCTIKVVSWNVAAMDGTHKDISTILRASDPPPPPTPTPINRHPEDRAVGGRSAAPPTGIGGHESGSDGRTGDLECKNQTGDQKEERLAVEESNVGDHSGSREERPNTQELSEPETIGPGDAGRESERISADTQGPTPIFRKTEDDVGESGSTTEGRLDKRPVQRAQSENNERIEGEEGRGRWGPQIDMSIENGRKNCIHVICLQEVVDVASPENFIRSSDEVVQKRWRDEIQAALPDYRCLAVQQLVGVLIFVYASPDIASQITTPSVTSVGTGLMGYMGNKGGAMARLVIGGLPAAGVSPPSYADNSLEEDREQEDERGARIVFVDCHLAAFTNATDRRNWDYAEIMRRAYFHPQALPISGGGTAPEAVAAAHPNGYPFSECDLVVWAGDLNYRLEMPNDAIRKAIHKFLPPEADGSDPPLVLSQDQQKSDSNDEAQGEDSEPNRSFEDTISWFLESDQLRKQQAQGKAFQYFHEGKIMFIPTYKYDVGTISTFDTSDKARVPSYCDRILWKDWKVEEEEIERVQARKLADARDRKRESHLRGTDHSDVLFDFGEEEEAGEESEAKMDGADPRISGKEVDHEITSINEIDISDIPSPLKLLKYTSHQAIASSDHKPVTAEFSLEYLGVDQEKRSQVQIEVVKELDRHENETRPAVTVIVDGDPNNEIVDFGDVTWDQVVRRTVTIANTGRTPATCEFVKRPVLQSIADEDEDGGYTKVTSADADPLAFGENSSAADGPMEEVCKEWLSATFNNAQTDGPHTLQPGEAEAVTLQLALPPRKNGRQPRSAYTSLLRHLNKGKEQLADVLVMRVSRGQDKFVPVKAEFKATFLGYGLTELLRVPDSAGGIRNNPKCDGEAHWSAPRELFRMTEYLLLTLKSIVMSEGGEGVRWTMLPGWPFVKETWGLSDDNGEDEEGTDELSKTSVHARSALKRWIRDSLDCDKDWAWEEVDKKGFSEEDKCETMAECLLDWLGYLKDGVLPASLYGEVVKGVGGKAGADKILDMLPTAAPPVHANVFVYLTGFISEVISMLSPKYDAAITNNFSASPAALVKRLSASSRLTTTELVKKNVIREFAEVILRRPTAMDGWRSETLERREEERRAAFLMAFVG